MARWKLAYLWPCLLLGVVAPLVSPGAVTAQARAAVRPDSTGRAIRLYLGCGGAPGCDFDYLRTQLVWIDYVRDQAAAQVQVISLSHGTGSGGAEITLKFIGVGEFAGVDDEVRFTTPQGATWQEQRREFTRVLSLGLARYLMRTPSGRMAMLHFDSNRTAAAERAVRDPWNSWVFRVSASGFLWGQSRSSTRQVTGRLSANRTTAAWKIGVTLEGSSSRSRYELSDGSEFIGINRSMYGELLVAGSLGNHFSLGATVNGWHATQDNIELAVTAAPLLEFDFFRYAEYTHRRLVAAYSIGVDRYVYVDTTLYNKTRETQYDETFTLWYATTEPWGSSFIGVKASNYLTDFQKNRVSLSSGLSLRVVKGLSLSLNGSYSRVHDQIFLAKAGASDEEVLLQLRQLQTSYYYSASMGLSYTFGSVFNNIVNPRFERGGAGAP
jgi:hypothetical protein